MEILDIEAMLERTVYHRLRKYTISIGYTLDSDLYDTNSNDINIVKTETERYKKDLTEIVNNKGFAIEIFGTANNQARGTKKPPRIVVESESFYEGELGLQVADNYIKNQNGTFTKVEPVSITNDWFFNIHLVANTIEQLRVLRQILIMSLPRRGYINWYTEKKLQKTQNLLCRYLTQHDLDWEQEGIMEKVYRFTISDVHVHDDIITDIIVPPIKEINFDIENEDQTFKDKNIIT